MTLEAPTTLLEFQRMFPDEGSCVTYLYQIRWPEGFVCPKCGDRRDPYLITDRALLECRKGHQTSITANTIMHRSKQSVQTWFYAAFLVSTLTPGISAVQFQKQLGIKNYEPAFQMLHKLRSALVDPDREPLKGEVEIDELYVGGPEEGRPGRGHETKALVVCAVEIVRWIAKDPKHPNDPTAGVEKVRAGRVRLTVIPDASAPTLIPWVQKNVAEGTIVYTDGWASYAGLTKLGYDHRKVLQSHQGKPTGEFLPMVHLIISNLKRWLTGTHKGAVLPKHMQAYLNEFTFRFNRRFWRGPAFTRILTMATHAQDWPEYEELYDVGKEGGWAHPNPRKTKVTRTTVEAVLAGLWQKADEPLLGILYPEKK